MLRQREMRPAQIEAGFERGEVARLRALQRINRRLRRAVGRLTEPFDQPGKVGARRVV